MDDAEFAIHISNTFLNKAPLKDTGSFLFKSRRIRDKNTHFGFE